MPWGLGASQPRSKRSGEGPYAEESNRNNNCFPHELLSFLKKDTVQLLCRQNRLPLGVFCCFSGGIWRPLHAFFVLWVINLLILQWKRRYWRKGRMWYFPKSKHKLGKRFVTGVAPSLQNWWTVERPLVGSTPIRFRHYWIKKKKVSLRYRINFLLFFFCPIITPHLKVMNGKQQ